MTSKIQNIINYNCWFWFTVTSICIYAMYVISWFACATKIRWFHWSNTRAKIWDSTNGVTLSFWFDTIPPIKPCWALGSFPDVGSETFWRCTDVTWLLTTVQGSSPALGGGQDRINWLCDVQTQCSGCWSKNSICIFFWKLVWRFPSWFGDKHLQHTCLQWQTIFETCVRDISYKLNHTVLRFQLQKFHQWKKTEWISTLSHCSTIAQAYWI